VLCEIRADAIPEWATVASRANCALKPMLASCVMRQSVG
jgi:hypothetical protein